MFVVQDNNMTPHFPEDELGKNSLLYSAKYCINDFLVDLIKYLLMATYI
jgi:hypothetical protein